MPPTATVSTTGGAAATGTPGSPPATRLARRRWRDWRLVAGVMLVLVSALLGARLVSALDDTVAVWAARDDLVAGAPLRAADLVAVPVRIEGTVNPYLTGDVPDGYVVARSLGGGELVPETAVVPAAQAERQARLVAVSVPVAALPGPLAAGDRVDVWVVPDALSDPDRPATLLVGGVTVSSAAPAEGTGFASGSTAGSVVLSLDDTAVGERLDEVTSRLVAASAAGRVALTLDPAPR